MDVEIEEEECGDWRDHLSKDEEAEYLAGVLDHRTNRRHTVVVAIVLEATGRTRTVPIKRYARARNDRFRAILDQLKDGERIVALRAVLTYEWIVKDVPPEILKKRLITNKQRARRRGGKKRTRRHLSSIYL